MQRLLMETHSILKTVYCLILKTASITQISLMEMYCKHKLFTIDYKIFLCCSTL